MGECLCICGNAPDPLTISRSPFPGSIKATGICVALAERYSNAFLEYSLLEELEITGGTAALRALAHVPLEPPRPPAEESSLEGQVEVALERQVVEYIWD